MATTEHTVTGVDFVSLPTQDLDRAADFYENVVGLTPGPRWQRSGMPAMGAEFETGTVTIALIVTERSGSSSARTTCRSRCTSTMSRRRARSSSRAASRSSARRSTAACVTGAVQGSRRERARPAPPLRAAGVSPEWPKPLAAPPTAADPPAAERGEVGAGARQADRSREPVFPEPDAAPRRAPGRQAAAGADDDRRAALHRGAVRRARHCDPAPRSSAQHRDHLGPVRGATARRSRARLQA